MIKSKNKIKISKMIKKTDKIIFNLKNPQRKIIILIIERIKKKAFQSQIIIPKIIIKKHSKGLFKTKGIKIQINNLTNKIINEMVKIIIILIGKKIISH
jgi:hypothetical protein